jgi:hypothetical protein
MVEMDIYKRVQSGFGSFYLKTLQNKDFLSLLPERTYIYIESDEKSSDESLDYQNVWRGGFGDASVVDEADLMTKKGNLYNHSDFDFSVKYQSVPIYLTNH